MADMLEFKRLTMLLCVPACIASDLPRSLPTSLVGREGQLLAEWLIPKASLEIFAGLIGPTLKHAGTKGTRR